MRLTLTSVSLALLAACSDRAQEVTVPEATPRNSTAITDPADAADPTEPNDPTYYPDTGCSNFTVFEPFDRRMTVTQRLHVIANVSGAGCTISWTADPIDAVTLTRIATGVEIYAKKATSSVTIRGTVGSTSKSFVMSILPANITVHPATATIVVNGTRQLSFEARDHNGSPLGYLYPDRVWSINSTNAAVATINTSTWVVTGKSAGTAQIRASLAGGTDSSTITVIADPVASVTVSPNPASVNTGETSQLTATLRSSNGTVLTGRTVTWASDDPSIVTVSSSGLVTGVGMGSTTIRATAEGKTGTAAVTVSQCLDCYGGEFPDGEIIP